MQKSETRLKTTRRETSTDEKGRKCDFPYDFLVRRYSDAAVLEIQTLGRCWFYEAISEVGGCGDLAPNGLTKSRVAQTNPGFWDDPAYLCGRRCDRPSRAWGSSSLDNRSTSLCIKGCIILLDGMHKYIIRFVIPDPAYMIDFNCSPEEVKYKNNSKIPTPQNFYRTKNKLPERE